MASFDLKSTFCLLVVVFCFINHNVEAREGKVFFNKLTHVDHPNNQEVGQALAQLTHVDHPNDQEVGQALAQLKAPAPGLAQANGRLGDGPGYGVGMVPQTKESWPSTTTYEDFKKLMATIEEEKGDKLPKALMATFDEEKGDKLPKAFDEEEEEGSQDPEDLNEQNYKYNNNRDDEYTYKTNNNYNDDNRRSYGNDQEERQGMSDTRFMENGKYFYDTRGRNSENTPSLGYENARGNDHPNDFETMKEFYKSIGGTQKEFEP